MKRFRVGSVPYVNAAPLIWWFESQGSSSPVDVLCDVPSALPARLESGQVSAILVSSIEAIQNPDREIIDGVCIASHGPVESVRVFSRLPFAQIKTLALDESSMTSNALAQILLSEIHGVKPKTITMPPDIHQMLKVADACVIIGDRGMTAQMPGVRIMDLGETWTDHTGLPFVWATWTGESGVDRELAYWLNHAAQQGSIHSGNWPEVVRYAQMESAWSLDLIERYLTDCIQFELGSEEKKGLELYAQKLVEHGLVSSAKRLKFVRGRNPAST
ncbi:MAG: menaquinone biosynthesis protein [Fimbriimonadaceae bacterium]